MRLALEGEGGSTSKTVKDIVSLYHLSYHRDEFEVTETKSRKNLRNQKRRPRIVPPSKRDPSVPNRWPIALPLCSHNIYWLKTHSTPCVCLGLCPYSLQNPGDGLLRVLPISSVSAQFEIVINHSLVEPITIMHIKKCDPRKGDFVSAMMRFSEWDLLEHGGECRWYLYPDFIINLLMHPASWSSWRNKSERAMRGRGDRRLAYFDSLVEDYKMLMHEDRRPFGCNLPWDDEAAVETISSESDDLLSEESSGSSVNKSDSSRVKQGKKIGKIRRPGDNEPKKVAKRLDNNLAPASAANALETSKDPYAHKRSPLNLYWIDRSKLPCLFYDDLHKEDAEAFRVLPICCSTYHCKNKLQYINESYSV